jgi:hypothetical protein
MEIDQKQNKFASAMKIDQKQKNSGRKENWSKPNSSFLDENLTKPNKFACALKIDKKANKFAFAMKI